jgi:acetyltransferase EpsM
MSAEPLVVIGAGEHARVVVDAALAGHDRWAVLGVVTAERTTADRAADGDASIAGLEDLGDDTTFLARLDATTTAARPALIVGVGAPTEPDVRRAIVARYASLARWATVLHPAATLAPSATIEPGAAVLAGAIVGPGAWVGAHAVVNSGAIIEHDVVLGAFSQVGPGAVVGGATTIGDGAFVGLGARIRDHLAIGAGAVVGMGAVVVSDVAADTTVLGVPARPRGAADAAGPSR